MTDAIRTPGKPKVDITSAALALDASNVRRYTGSVAAVLAFSETSRVAGKSIEVIVPAGKSTAAPTFPNPWNATAEELGYVLADDFDNALDFRLKLATVDHNGTVLVSASYKELLQPDTTAPTVVSVTGADGSDQLTVEFDEPVILSALTGLTLLPWTVGTTRTLSSITSGSGTTTVVFTMSGNLSTGDTFDFTYSASNEITDQSNNALATGSTSASLGGGAAFPQLGSLRYRYSATLQSTITGGVVDDQHGSNDGAASGVTLTSGKFEFANDTANVNSGLATPSTSSSFTYMARVSRTSGQPWIGTARNIVSGTAASPIGLAVYFDTAMALEPFYNGTQYSSGADAAAWVAGTEHVVVARYNATADTLDFFIDDMVTPVLAFTDVTSGPGAQGNTQWGAYASAVGWANGMSEMLDWSVALTGTELAEAVAAMP